MIKYEKSKRKTILWHLHNLPEPYRTQAIENASNSKVDLNTPSFTQYAALMSAFHWNTSKEGGEYWEKFSNTLWSQVRESL